MPPKPPLEHAIGFLAPSRAIQRHPRGRPILLHDTVRIGLATVQGYSRYIARKRSPRRPPTVDSGDAEHVEPRVQRAKRKGVYGAFDDGKMSCKMSRYIAAFDLARCAQFQFFRCSCFFCI